MKKYITFLCLALNLSTRLCAAVPTIKIPEAVIAKSHESLPFCINDRDEVLLRFESEAYGYNSTYAIWREDQSLEELNSGYSLVGNSGALLAVGYDLLILTQSMGLQQLNLSRTIPGCLRCDGLSFINSDDTVFGNYIEKTWRKRAFVWKNGVAKEFLPNDLGVAGYEPIHINVIAINNIGVVLGSLEFGP